MALSLHFVLWNLCKLNGPSFTFVSSIHINVITMPYSDLFRVTDVNWTCHCNVSGTNSKHSQQTVEVQISASSAYSPPVTLPLTSHFPEPISADINRETHTHTRTHTHTHTYTRSYEKALMGGAICALALSLSLKWSVSPFWSTISYLFLNPCPAEPGYTLPLQTV